jgi:hypothetical protein
MAAQTPYRISPVLGPDTWQIQPALGSYWDGISQNVGAATVVPSYGLGTPVIGNDGHTYVYVKASAAIASGVAIIVTEPAFTAATGAGLYTAPVTAGAVAIPIGAFFHARRTLL